MDSICVTLQNCKNKIVTDKYMTVPADITLNYVKPLWLFIV